MSDETGTCHKCKEQISVDATKCPHCGYEPSKIGAIMQIFGFLVLLGFLFCALIVLITPLLILDSLALSSGLISLAVFGFGALVTGGILYSMYLRTELTATDDETVELIPSHRD